MCNRNLIALAVTLGIQLGLQHDARALVQDIPLASPPVTPPCTASSAKLTPGLNGNSYSFSGYCFINIAADKYDQDHPQWIRSNVTVTGSYNTTNQLLSETLTFSSPSGPLTLVNSAWCDQDPWLTPEDCTLNPEALRGNVIELTGLDVGLNPGHRGPLSLIVLSPTLIHQLLSKQESKPPRPPVNVDPVIWPVDNGKSTRVTINWNAGDMTGSRWVMEFDVETSKQKTDSDGAYSKVGQVLGLGPKPRMTVSDMNRVYVYTLPSELQPIDSYFFRVCAVNDADRQCSAPIKARAPTMQEKMTHVGAMQHVVSGKVGAPSSGGGSVTARSTKPLGPIALGTARPSGTGGTSGGNPAGGNGPTPLGTARPGTPIALGTARPGAAGGSSGGSPAGGNGPTPLGTARPGTPIALGTARLGSPAGSNGGASGGQTPAGGTPPTSIGGGKPVTAVGGNPPSTIGTLRPIGPVAGIGHPGAQPGEVAFPDLAIGPAMVVHDHAVMWGSATTLNLRADATRTCPLPISFQFRNAGNGPAQNVTAEIRDGLNAMQPVAVQTLASMVAGQSSTVGGVWKVGLLQTPRAVIVEARVREAGGIHEKDLANNHGAVTLNLTCK